MASNYCSHCGAKLTKEAKFCPGCGRAIGEPVKKRKYIGGGFFAISIIFFLVGFFFLGTNPKPQDPGQATAVVFFLLAGIFYFAAIIEFFKWLFRKNRYVFWAVLALVILIPFFTVIYEQYQRLYISQIFEIQDIAAEVAYSKSVGDDLIEGKVVSGANFFLEDKAFGSVYAQEKITSMAQVHAKVKKEYGKIKAKKVQPEVESYKGSVETWTLSILNASNLKTSGSPTFDEATKWRSLPQAPSVVTMNLESDRRSTLLDNLVDRIKPLQNTGDTAIASQDRSAMRAVAARALIQSNFADSLSSKTQNVCRRGGCIPEVKSFISGVYRTAHNYSLGNQAAPQDWNTTWNDAPEIIKSGGTPLGGLGINQGATEPTPPPNPSTTIRNVTPFLWWPRPQTAPWDGRYTSSANVNCDAQSGDFGQSIAEGAVGDFEVRGGKIIGGAEEVAIDSAGHASYNANVVGISVTADYYFTQTAGGGVSVSGNMTLFGQEEGASVSCTGDFTGNRISL